MIGNLKCAAVGIDELLSVNKYNVDEDHAHIELASDTLMKLEAAEFGKLVRICPAGLYRETSDGVRSFDYAGCLECGTCRIACDDTIIKKWKNPSPMMGVVYRFG